MSISKTVNLPRSMMEQLMANLVKFTNVRLVNTVFMPTPMVIAKNAQLDVYSAKQLTSAPCALQEPTGMQQTPDVRDVLPQTAESVRTLPSALSVNLVCLLTKQPVSVLVATLLALSASMPPRLAASNAEVKQFSPPTKRRLVSLMNQQKKCLIKSINHQVVKNSLI
jgi:hypothetical protein